MQLFVEHLTVIDSAYLDPTHGIVGESWIVDATLEGDLDPQSMVMDFGHVKKQLKAAIDDSLDHTLIAAEQAPGLSLSREGEKLVLRYNFGDNETLEHRSPPQAVTLLNSDAVNIDSLVQWLEEMLMKVVPSTVHKVQIALRHEDASPAHYHYAHGLKKHDGNCQRIAHGHRSRIMVWENGERSAACERRIAGDLNHAYLASAEDCIGQDGANSLFKYTSDQGEFFLSYPTARCRFLPTDSTVECIAQHLAADLKHLNSEHEYRVRAYEGVQKGAIASA